MINGSITTSEKINDEIRKEKTGKSMRTKWTPFQAFYYSVFIISFSFALACIFNGVSPVELIREVMK